MTNKADIAFIMDSSGKVSRREYNNQKDVVKALVNNFNISSNGVRVALITYDFYAYKVFGFGKHPNTLSLKKAISIQSLLGGRPRIDKALNLAADIFTEARPAVPKILFLLTSSHQGKGNDIKPLDEAVMPLRALGVKLSVLSAGSVVNRELINLLAEKPKDIFSENSFSDFLPLIPKIIKNSKSGAGRV